MKETTKEQLYSTEMTKEKELNDLYIRGVKSYGWRRRNQQFK
jgi:hypothetical protein